MASNGTKGHSGVDISECVRWVDLRVEEIPPNEAEDIQAVADEVNQMQKKRFDNHRHMYSGTHARAQGIVKEKMIVGDLPPHLAQTLFSKPTELPIVMWYSTEPGDPGIDDRIPQPRGLGMKVFDVQGEISPALELADAKTTKEIFDIRIKYGADNRELYRQIEARDDTELQEARDEFRNTRLEVRDYVVKYSLVPIGVAQKKLYKETAEPDSHRDDILGEWPKEFYSKHQAGYLFQVQFCENLDERPVEYAVIPWEDEKYPWQIGAKVVVPQQDSYVFARKTFWEDHMVLNSWHGLKSFQPLGSPNKLRRVVYPAGASLRHKYIGGEINISSIDQIPDSGYVTG
ncbi:hypothetical protein BDZ45DRAFT_712831 [Acephala macrosclerotiorum]|nr:hypothetical protein BDZ45DRAFT_712831 [Acephala macrosclerotiorum]